MAERAEGVRSLGSEESNSKSLPNLRAEVSPNLATRQNSARRSKSKSSLRSRQMQKRLNFMKQRKLGKTPRPEWKDIPLLATEKPYHFQKDEKYCRVGYTIPRKKHSMGLAPLPEPPISYKTHKPSLPKPKSIFKTRGAPAMLLLVATRLRQPSG